jgi:two-component system, NtrC family, C4-dicarboxylate transport response regulator DctD
MKSLVKIMIVEDDQLLGQSYKRCLRSLGAEIEIINSAEKALSCLANDWPGIIVTDIMMPGMDGLELMKKVKCLDQDLPVVLVTGRGDIPMAVEAIRDGAYDFLEKPIEMELLKKVIEHALEKRQFVLELRKLRTQVANQSEKSSDILGISPIMEQLRKVIHNVADSQSDVLIYGETGTGKDLVARCLHDQSQRRDHPFVAINCGAIPESIFESELFGHEAGSFTGANQKRIGKFEYAHQGTIFLDEIESMPLNMQVKLLRVLQERVVERMGSNKLIPIDIRVIAATKVDLKKASDQNQFRLDLFYRLNVIPICIPPLRERKDDIPILFRQFVDQYCKNHDMKSPTILPGYFKELVESPWEGNIRELKNEAEKYALGMTDDLVTVPAIDGTADVTFEIEMEGFTLAERVAEYEKKMIENELIRNKGNINKTLDTLKIPRQTLRDKMKKFGINRDNYELMPLRLFNQFGTYFAL